MAEVSGIALRLALAMSNRAFLCVSALKCFFGEIDGISLLRELREKELEDEMPGTPINPFCAHGEEECLHKECDLLQITIRLRLQSPDFREECRRRSGYSEISARIDELSAEQLREQLRGVQRFLQAISFGIGFFHFSNEEEIPYTSLGFIEKFEEEFSEEATMEEFKSLSPDSDWFKTFKTILDQISDLRYRRDVILLVKIFQQRIEETLQAKKVHSENERTLGMKRKTIEVKEQDIAFGKKLAFLVKKCPEAVNCFFERKCLQGKEIYPDCEDFLEFAKSVGGNQERLFSLKGVEEKGVDEEEKETFLYLIILGLAAMFSANNKIWPAILEKTEETIKEIEAYPKEFFEKCEDNVVNTCGFLYQELKEKADISLFSEESRVESWIGVIYRLNLFLEAKNKETEGLLSEVEEFLSSKKIDQQEE